MSIIDELLNFIQQHPRLLVITGAGCSQPSGIPTYRDEEGAWQRSTPIQHKEFMEKESVRKRYWARSYSGWPSIRGATPNNAHHSLESLEALGYIQQLVTQNVDGLHRRSGIKKDDLSELHGNCYLETCWTCKQEYLRSYDVQGGVGGKGCKICAERVPHFCHCTFRRCACGERLKDSIIHFKVVLRIFFFVSLVSN